MKAVRIGVLTVVLLVGATSRSVPTRDDYVADAPSAFAQTPGPCYLINGIWICEP